MRKPVLIGILFAVVAIIGGALLVANHNSSSTTTTPPATSTTTPEETTPPPAETTPPSTSNTVAIENFAFSPASLTVKKGTTVTWTNKDSATHTVTENDGQTGPSSGDLANGKTYSFTYNTVGTFKYHCTIHTDMTGTVTVTE